MGGNESRIATTKRQPDDQNPSSNPTSTRDLGTVADAICFGTGQIPIGGAFLLLSTDTWYG